MYLKAEVQNCYARYSVCAILHVSYTHIHIYMKSVNFDVSAFVCLDKLE